MYLSAVFAAAFVVLTFVFWVLFSAGPLAEDDSPVSVDGSSVDGSDEEIAPYYHDPEQLPEDIPFRPILIRNEISPRTLQNWLMREQVREGRQYLENRIHQIGEVRANRIREWANGNRVIPKPSADDEV